MFVSAQEAGERLKRLVNQLSGTGGACYITDEGRARAVLLDIDKYHAMMDALEDVTAGGPETELARDLIKAIIRRAKTH